MSDPHRKILLILDDRELAGGEVRALVGPRRFGDIVFKRRPLLAHFQAALPDWASTRLVHLRTQEDLPVLRTRIEASAADCAACVIAGRAGFMVPDRLTQLIERLPYAEEDFTDRLYKPLLVYLRNAHHLIERWPAFETAPIHTWTQSWHGSQRVDSVKPLDLATTRDFLSFTCGSTATRHFNDVQIDTYYYTKRSTDRRKMLAEYSFYGLVPESMRPWLIQPFDYRDDGERAAYRMLRYYLADAALQWVHGAFDPETFADFVDRILFFLVERPVKPCSKAQSAAMAGELYIDKLQRRARQFLASDEGRRINALAAAATADLDLNRQIERYRRLYAQHERGFVFDRMVVGHGDPCLSNILYDQQRYLLRLIDPKGAVSEDEIWTHPLYDLCKISHSVLGDYDFINNGLYAVSFTDDNDLVLDIRHTDHAVLKQIFRDRVAAMGYDLRLMRLGEASLFLSMLPLHIDYPNKVIAFMVKAKHILDEVEGG